MKKIIKHGTGIIGRQRGVTLVEVIVVMIISTLLIVTAALGVGVFFRKYKELNAWAELQTDALDALNIIKNGVPVGSGDNMEYYGVTNAMKLQLTNTTTNTANGIRIVPPTDRLMETNDYAHFFLYDGVVRCTYVFHGIQVASPLYIFPKEENLGKMVVDRFLITKLNQEQEVLAVQVELHARVKTGTDNFRTVRFRTKMAKK
ncbi:MAG: prepilin-type N-terminal cleavage/methylation domain-containing protein [Candidatus Syntrophosphaera sp.]|nr:prepilin-type N-terminal cleavage/methylation domain-containing protein [Candidatus Syntrophosphaera sp.]